MRLLRLATDAQEQTDRRCDAVEQLDQQSVALDEKIIRSLLTDDDATVARYALGLVPTSPHRDALLIATEESPHRDDNAFMEEATLLRRMTHEGKWHQELHNNN